MEYINKKIGTVISLLRKSHGLSQEELAELAGLHRTYISKVEQGNRNITINSLSKISDALQVPLSQLIREAELYGKDFKN